MSELEAQERRTRSEAAALLRDLADQLDEDGSVSLELGGQRVTLDPVDPLTLKLEGESDWSTGQTEAKQSIEIELVWRRAAETAEEATLHVEPGSD